MSCVKYIFAAPAYRFETERFWRHEGAPHAGFLLPMEVSLGNYAIVFPREAPAVVMGRQRRRAFYVTGMNEIS
jgi:hypothetical protein